VNPLLEQFLSESRELIDRSSDAFLVLEKEADHSETLNALFRYVHTIKGGSGLFDIEPFTHLVHVTEDSLSRARNGEIRLDARCIDVYLLVLDQLTVWLEQLENNEQLPDSAVFDGKRLIKQLQDVVLGEPETPANVGDTVSILPVKSSPGPAEIIDHVGLTSLEEGAKSKLVSAIKAMKNHAFLVVYTPEESAFFSGDDPLNNWLQIPDIRWQLVDDPFTDVNLESFDPYLCQVRLIGLTTATREQVELALQYVLESVELIDLPPSAEQATPGVLTPASIVARAQLRLLKTAQATGQPESAMQSAYNVVSHMSKTVAGLEPSTVKALTATPVLQDYVQTLEAALPEFDKAQLDGGEHAAAPCDDSVSLETESMMPMVDAAPVSAARDETIKTIKVDQERLEQLVDLTGELIVAKNSMQHLARRVEEEYGIKQLSRELKSEHAVLNRISESLQGVVMQIRMIPVSTLFQRFPRLVRDLSRRLDKKIELVIEGEDTEADKNIVEQLADPLIHLVRNSIDHGIEMPEVRAALGKSETGTIKLSARTVEDSVQIEIRDDGNGIDPAAIREKAIQKGVISAEEAANLTDQASLHLIFEAGFSTCDQVTDLSGRGVGMDVVRTTVSRIGGHIEIESEKGQGSVIRVTLPASITVSRVMMFEMAGQVYGIPVEMLTETIKIAPERLRKIKNGEAYVLRKQLIPVYRMASVLGLRSASSGTDLSILNLNINGQTVGMVVDRLLEGVDVIVKPMEGVMERFPIYSGAAVLGDGRVLLVVNPKEIQLCH